MVRPHALTVSDVGGGDSNGILFVPLDRLAEIVEAAAGYRETEGQQLSAMRDGQSSRSQVRFADYLSRRDRDPTCGFRQHLKEVATAGEV